MILRDLVERQAYICADAIAIVGPDGCITYGMLDCLSNQCAHALAGLGVRQGDRVGIWLEKSAFSVVVMQAVLRLHATYVPLDPLSPAERIRTILSDCEMRALVTTQKRSETVLAGGEAFAGVACLCLDGTELNWNTLLTFSDRPLEVRGSEDLEIAYILYTSGSTGTPKGVCISNRNALAFVEWAASTLQATPADRFASHAPFHFDLSVLDLYAAFYCGASVFLIPESISYLPEPLTNFIMQEALTIWYSVPSVLILMMEQGGFLNLDLNLGLSLRALLYAGEPFPIKYVRQLSARWPHIRLLNLYGPTETNVCTFYEIRPAETDYIKTVPIGKACSGDHVWAQKADGTLAQPGEEGELMVSGPTVMVGYWGRPRQGQRPYATGDIVRLQEDGNYVYVGRRDHLVKVRGYRVEPGDIEAALQTHAAIHEAAVLVVGSGMQARITAFVSCNQHEAPSLLELKRHCAERLPRYMIIDTVRVLPALPRTRNGKVDRLTLLQEVSAELKFGRDANATI